MPPLFVAGPPLFNANRRSSSSLKFLSQCENEKAAEFGSSLTAAAALVMILSSRIQLRASLRVRQSLVALLAALLTFSFAEQQGQSTGASK
jgi:hypothetical protein